MSSYFDQVVKYLRTRNDNLSKAVSEAVPLTMATAARTSLSGGSTVNELEVNTHYTTSQAGQNCTCLLPASAACTKGDVITLVCVQNQDIGKFLKLGTAGDALSAGSIGFFSGGAVKMANGSQTCIVIKGQTDGDGGPGTRIECIFDGSAWVVTIHGNSQGTGLEVSHGDTAFFDAAITLP